MLPIKKGRRAVLLTLTKQIVRYVLIILCLLSGTLHTKINNNKESLKYNTLHQICFCDFCEEIRHKCSIKTYKTPISTKGINRKKKNQQQKKLKARRNKRTVMIYMAADNDLRPFAARNIQQMANVGSNKNLTIVVHLDIRISGSKKITRRYLIEKDQVLHIDPYNPLTQQMDSGNPATLISFCEWATQHYPADFLSANGLLNITRLMNMISFYGITAQEYLNLLMEK
jgi:hypothetical protein